MRLGVTYVPTIAPERLREVAETGEAAGLDELWVWEDCFQQSGVASAAAALAWTSRIRVGIGLMPAPLRNVALCAMEVATLERMFPGRLIAGVGHGVQDWMGQAGARVASPLTLLEEYTEALRGLLDGRRLTVAGRYVQLTDVALDWPPADPPTLLVGGSGPKSLALAARLGDGLLLGTALTDDEISAALRIADEHATRRPHPVTATLIAATGADAQSRLDREIERWGRSTDRGIGAAGGATEIAAVVNRLGRLGLSAVSVQPTEDEPDLTGFVAFLGREVRPLLAASA